MTGSPVAVVVETDAAELHKTEQAFEASGFVVMTADSFAQARTLLASMTPDIVIAAIKLKSFNGLHLAALCAVWRPGLPFIVTDSGHDIVLEADAKQLSATYVIKTPGREELTQAAVTLLNARPGEASGVRRSYRKPAPVPTVVKVAAASAEVVDISYGGVRLKLPPLPSESSKNAPPPSFDILFPQMDLSLHGARVWTSPDSAAGGWVCGVDISQNETDNLQRWRDFVDSVV
jgi:chemotaxis response regulator CheB